MCPGLLYAIITDYAVMAKGLSKNGVSSARNCVCISPSPTQAFTVLIEEAENSLGKKKKKKRKKSCYLSFTTGKGFIEQFNSLLRSVCESMGK